MSLSTLSSASKLQKANGEKKPFIFFLSVWTANGRRKKLMFALCSYSMHSTHIILGLAWHWNHITFQFHSPPLFLQKSREEKNNKNLYIFKNRHSCSLPFVSNQSKLGNRQVVTVTFFGVFKWTDLYWWACGFFREWWCQWQWQNRGNCCQGVIWKCAENALKINSTISYVALSSFIFLV